MKRLIVLPIITLIICGCSNIKKTTPILNNISFTAQISYGEQEYTSDVAIAENNINLVVSKPEQINGLTLNIKFVCLPANATHTDLDFYNEEKTGITRNDLGENTTSLVFDKTNISTTLFAITTDGLKTSYSIKINLVSPSLFPGII